MNIIQALLSGLLIIPMALLPNFAPPEGELRGSTSYLNQDLHPGIDWVQTFPATNGVRDGIPGSVASAGAVTVITVKNGFASHTFQDEGVDLIDKDDIVPVPEGWDFLPEGVPVPAYLTETQTVDRVLRFENTSAEDWTVNDFAVTVAEPEDQPEDSVHELHQLVTPGTVISEQVDDFVVPAGETLYLHLETISPKIHTLYTNPAGGISGLKYVENVNYSIKGFNYEFNDYATAGVAKYSASVGSDSDSHTDPASYLYTFSEGCLPFNNPGYFLGLCGTVFTGSSGMNSMYVSELPMVYNFTGRVITDAGDPMESVEVTLKKRGLLHV